MLACSVICLWAIRRSEAAFYTRASLLMSAAPESAGKMMQALKSGLPEQEAAGAGLLKRYGYEAGLFAFHDFAGLAVRLSFCFLLLGAAGFSVTGGIKRGESSGSENFPVTWHESTAENTIWESVPQRMNIPVCRMRFIRP